MKKEIAKTLKDFTDVVCKRYSNKERVNNFNNETFKVQEIIPTSDHTATVIYEKNTFKRAAFFFIIYHDKKNGIILYQLIHI